MNDISKWKDFYFSRNGQLREELITENLPLVSQVTRVMHRGTFCGMEYEDMYSYGVIGLIDAVDKFDPHMGNKFSSYAYYRIRGSIIDELRNLDYLPRSIRHKANQIKATVNSGSCVGITEYDMARETCNTLQDFNLVWNLVSEVPINTSFDGMFYNVVSSTMDDPSMIFERKDSNEKIAACIEKLKPKEKKVLLMHFYDEMTLHEISRLMNMSQAGVSQYKRKAVSKLSNMLRESIVA